MGPYTYYIHKMYLYNGPSNPSKPPKGPYHGAHPSTLRCEVAEGSSEFRPSRFSSLEGFRGLELQSSGF